MADNGEQHEPEWLTAQREWREHGERLRRDLDRALGLWQMGVPGPAWNGHPPAVSRETTAWNGVERRVSQRRNGVERREAASPARPPLVRCAVCEDTIRIEGSVWVHVRGGSRWCVPEVDIVATPEPLDGRAPTVSRETDEPTEEPDEPTEEPCWTCGSLVLTEVAARHLDVDIERQANVCPLCGGTWRRPPLCRVCAQGPGPLPQGARPWWPCSHSGECLVWEREIGWCQCTRRRGVEPDGSAQ